MCRRHYAKRLVVVALIEDARGMRLDASSSHKFGKRAWIRECEWRRENVEAEGDGVMEWR
jgi:hypothetical protein